jgi:hypothetical protein
MLRKAEDFLPAMSKPIFQAVPDLLFHLLGTSERPKVTIRFGTQRQDRFEE